jgi:hypothetical protein
MRVVVHAFPDLTATLMNDQDILTALSPAEIELVDRIHILGSTCIEFVRQKLKKFPDCGGLHASCAGIDVSGSGSRVRAAPGENLVTKSDRCRAAFCAEKFLREGLDDGRVITLAAENVQVCIVRVVCKVTADQRSRNQLHHGIPRHTP